MSATRTVPDPPWLAVPVEVRHALSPVLSDIVEEVIAVVPQAVPAYARPLEGRFGEGVRKGVEVALGRFLQLPGTREEALTPESRRVYAALGRGEVRQGRTLEGLLAAYRAGARVTLRRMSRGALQAGLDPDTVVALGESVLAYIEELSAASADGFAFEQLEQAGEMDRRRVELLELLLLGAPDEVAAQLAAAAAGWVLPPAIVAVTMPVEEASAVRFQLGPRALTMPRVSDAVALVPAPRSERERAELVRALTGRGAVIGPAREWSRAPESLRLATIAATVLAVDNDLDTPPRWVEEHLTDLVLGAESQALDDLATLRLAPLAGLRPSQRDKLTTTLLAWLRHWGQRGPIADELAVHPQTVGYRVAQLRDLFGPSLDDPQVRFELELVLRAGHV